MTRPAVYRALVVSIVLLMPAGHASAQSVRFEQPILVTSAGQSADVTIAGMLFKKAGLPARVVAQAKPADLDGQKTLVLVPGFSSKGMGSAGIDKDQEMARVMSLIGAAQSANVKILVLHIGGKARRGTQSDSFNRAAATAASHLVVVRAGDEDQFFTKLAGEKKISIDVVDRISDATEPVGKLFK
jgi:hypothetical protein